MTTPDQNIAYLSKREKIVLLILAEIKRLSLSHSDNVIFYPVELESSKDKKGNEVVVLNLEKDHIIDILQKFNFFKILKKYPDSEGNQIYELEINQEQFTQSEIFLLQELGQANSFKQYSGDSITSLELVLDKNSKRDMEIIINNNEKLSISVNRVSKYWSLLLEVAKNKMVPYVTSVHKNKIQYLNKGKDCKFYSQDKYKPTDILKVKNGKIKATIHIKVKK